MNFMKILAIILSISCLIDIVKPSITVIKAFKKGLEKEVVPFVISQLLNVIALIFFITFIVKY